MHMYDKRWNIYVCMYICSHTMQEFISVSGIYFRTNSVTYKRSQKILKNIYSIRTYVHSESLSCRRNHAERTDKWQIVLGRTYFNVSDPVNWKVGNEAPFSRRNILKELYLHVCMYIHRYLHISLFLFGKPWSKYILESTGSTVN